MGKLKEWEEKLEQRSKRNDEKIAQAKEDIQRAKETNKEERHREKPTEQEEFYRNGNRLMKWYMLDKALPGLFVIVVLLIFVAFAAWEWITGLF